MKPGELGDELLMELKRAKTLPPYNAAGLSLLIREINDYAESLRKYSENLTAEQLQHPPIRSALTIRGQTLLRSKRCALSYLYTRFTRLTNLWWSCGHALPEEVKVNLSPHELVAYDTYDQILSEYMRDSGISVANDQQPPRDSLIEIEALEDCGEVITEQGPVTLTKHSRHLIRRAECELLIKQGLVQQIHNP